MTTVRFLNGDLIIYPCPDTDPEELINAICDTYPTPIHAPIHPLQVALYKGDEKDDIMNAIIFPKKRVVLNEFHHVFKKNDNIINWDALDLYGTRAFDLEGMTNESIIRHILSHPCIPNRIFANPSDIVVDFIVNQEINNQEINEWFISNIESERGRYIFSNPSDRIIDIMANINVNSLFEKYQTWSHNTHEYDYTFSTMAECILDHPLATEEMIATVTDHAMPELNYKIIKDEKNTLRFLSEFRHYKYGKLHPEFLITLTELLSSLQYADCEIVFGVI